VGRKIQRLRPTKSIVKNALFNILGNIEELLFLDLFAGTGQIGLEAERRGAKVIFVEKNKKLASEISKKTRKGRVVIGDALRFLERLKEEADIIFADPPYAYGDYERLIKLALSRLRKGGIFILEHDKRRSFGANQERRYGDTVLSIWVKE